jgi:hypothetical protein
MRLVETPRPAGRGLTVDRLWIWVGVLVPVFRVWVIPMGTVDLAYHVRLGDAMLSGAGIPRADTFSFTAAGRPWVDQQWAAQIALAALHRAGGWATVAGAWAVLTAAAMAFLILACRELGAPPRAAVVLSLGGFAVAAENLAMRPQVFAVVLFSAVQWLVARRRRRPRGLFLVPVLGVVWANVHGSFALAPLLLGLAWLEDRRDQDTGARRTLLIGMASVLATLANPFGFGAWRYVVEISSNPTIRDLITEWAPPTPRTYSGAAFLVSILLVTAYLARRKAPVPWLTLLRLGVFVAIAAPAVRGTVWWGFAAPAAIAPLVGAPRRKRGAGRPAANRAMAAAVTAAAIAGLPWWWGRGGASLLDRAPVAIADDARSRLPPGSHVLVAQDWASWFEYADPSMKVFVDSRIEVYPQAVWDDYFSARDARTGWQATLERRGVQAAVLNPGQAGPLIDAMLADPGWRLVAQDDGGYLFVRR